MDRSWRSIFTLVFFVLTNISVGYPTTLHIPVPHRVVSIIKGITSAFPLRKRRQSISSRTTRWFRIPLTFRTTPIAAILLLLATGCLHGDDIKRGIVGSDGIQPLNIMALFISLAYLSISLDVTGLFRFLAFWVATKGGSSGRRLYLSLYLFFFVAGLVVGNDPVILSGTAFLAHLTRVSGIVPPTAWIFAHFVTANTASAVLPPSNPTNLVLTGAFGISFVSYMGHTILPVLAAAATIYPLLIFYLFSSRELIPREIDLIGLRHVTTSRQSVDLTEDHRCSNASVNETHPGPGNLTDRNGAIFGSILLGVALVVLVGTSPIRVPVWEITIPPAIIMLCRDVWHDRRKWRKQSLFRQRLATGQDLRPGPIEQEGSNLQIQEPNTSDESQTGDNKTLPTWVSYVERDLLPTLSSVATRLPLSLVPFAFCMFILVQALTSHGWVETFATWWAGWIRVCSKNGSNSALVGAVGGMLFVSVLLCNFCGTNIGTTILLARVLQTWLGMSSTSPLNAVNINHSQIKTGSIYALAIGTNFGAYTFTFSASLAGLLWRELLRQKGIHVRQSQFAIINLPIIVLAVCSAATVLVAEIFISNKNPSRGVN